MRSPLLLAFLLLGCRSPEPATPPIDYPEFVWNKRCPHARIVDVPATSDQTGNPSLVWECPDACPEHGLRPIGADTR